MRFAWPVVHVEHFDDTHAVMAEEFQDIRLRGFVRVFECENDADYHLVVTGVTDAQSQGA